MASKQDNLTKKKADQPRLTAISVAGYKSLVNEQRIEVRPLTILAGANSGGKSSIMQPLLLLKQTLEATYDPGSLLLNGPNVRLTSADQLLSRISKSKFAEEFLIGLEMGKEKVEFVFRREVGKGLEIVRNTFVDPRTLKSYSIEHNMTGTNLVDELNNAGFPLQDAVRLIVGEVTELEKKLRVIRDRCFLDVELLLDERGPGSFWRPPFFHSDAAARSKIVELIHVPGLRGNPERNYKIAAVGSTFTGTFENYIASVIHRWQSDQDERLSQLSNHLKNLTLTGTIKAEQRDETQVELKVGRLPHGAKGGAQDLVSIADVGFGVSQTLPVLVALLAAAPGQIVYLEQPEIHLHPRAQRAMAAVLAEAAQRGVTVIVETHSALLLRGVQTLVAKSELSPDLIKLHWFQRDNSGATTITSADLDDTGAFGDWPEDFDEVALNSENDYLSAAEAKLFEKK